MPSDGFARQPAEGGVVTAWALTVVLGIVWPAVALVVAWRVGLRLREAGDRYPVPTVDVADGIELVPAVACQGCAECTP